MGTHPIFESDFDCLTDWIASMSDNEVEASPVEVVESEVVKTNPCDKYDIPDCPVEEMNPLQQRWHKIRSYGAFPIIVKYYGECGLPLEYVQYLPEQLRRQAMEEAKNDDNLAELVDEINVTDGDKKSQKRGGKVPGKAKKKVEPGDVKIGRISRGRKKNVTRITGLSTYEIELKKTAKIFGNKFACGASSSEKADEIVIQGDFIDQVIEILEDKFPQIPSNKIIDLGDIK